MKNDALLRRTDATAAFDCFKVMISFVLKDLSNIDVGNMLEMSQIRHILMRDTDTTDTR